MTIDENISKKISLLSLIASVFVVLIHAPVTRHPGGSMLFESFIGMYMASTAVPFFFAVSGFLLAMKLESEGYMVEVRKRVRSLLFPYLFWCIALTLLASLNSFAHNISMHSSLMRNINLNPIDWFGIDLRKNPPLPLWYIRALMIYVLFSVIFQFIAQKRNLTILVLITLLIFDCTKYVYMPEWTSNILTFDLRSCNIGAFLIGMHLSYWPLDIQKKIGYPSIIIGTILFAYLAFVKCEYLSLPRYVVIILSNLGLLLSIMGAWLLCPPLELPEYLKRQSFPIYLLHAIFVPYVLLISQKIPVLQEWWGFLVNVFVLAGLSLFTSYLLRRLMPRFSAFIFGGR